MTQIIRKIKDELPEVDFSVASSGITIFSDRFLEPRFLEFEIKGKCGKCSTNTVDIDYFVSANSIEIRSSRFSKPKYIVFDLPTPLPDKCFFRVRSKGHTYMIPYHRTTQDASTSTEIEPTMEINLQKEDTKMQTTTEKLGII